MIESRTYTLHMKTRLDLLVKLSLVALAFAGIYYLVIYLPSIKNAQLINDQITASNKQISDELAMKQKCQQDGDSYIQKNLSTYIPGNNKYGGILAIQNQNFFYNKKLNTCLISYQLWGSGRGDAESGYRTQYYIEDVLSSQRIALFNDFSQMIPSQESWGYNAKDPKCAALDNMNLCFSNRQQYTDSIASLVNSL